MNYFLFKLRFETAVHFGPSDAALPLAASEEHVRADTLFSALCQTALCLYGPEGVEELCGQVQEGSCSSATPALAGGNTLFLPKPVTPVETEQDLPSEQKKKRKSSGGYRYLPGRIMPLPCRAAPAFQSKRVALSLGGIWSGQRRRHPRGAMRSLTKWGYFNIRGLAGRRNGKNASIVRMPGHVVGSTSCVPASRSRLIG